MAIETEQLEYWGNKFTRHGLERYMTFDAFMRNPRKYWLEIMGGPHRPLLPQQRDMRRRIDRASGGLENTLSRLEQKIEGLRRIDNGHPYEQLKHHANGR